MPVRSFGSSVLKWPDRRSVERAIRHWLESSRGFHPALVRFGFYGSYARGDWGVGSDLDCVAIVTESARTFTERPLDWDLIGLPVPASVVIYTVAEWNAMSSEASRFVRTVEQEAVWLLG